MPIHQLTLKGFRCFEDACLHFHPHNNLIFGDNASGKSTLLEALHVLSRVKSFRTRGLSELIPHQHAQFLIQATVDENLSLGVSHGGASTQVRFGGEDVNKLSSLAAHFPVSVFHTESTRLITDSPQYRRAFLNWGVFHVKPQFGQHWRSFIKVLKQRNTLLRYKRVGELDFWDQQFHQCGTAVMEDHQAYVASLKPVLSEMLDRFLPGLNISFSYFSGTSGDQSLEQAIQEKRGKELDRGQSCYGPQRADLVFKVDGMAVKDALSRGQIKLVSLALYLANLQVWQKDNDRPIWSLVDDLGAELDEDNANKALDYLTADKLQLFYTSIETPEWLKARFSDGHMFHVERGSVKHVVY